MVPALVDRDSGKGRTMVVDDVKAETLMPIVIANVRREARIMTDEHGGYRDKKRWFARRGTTSHGRGEYVSLEDRDIHSNTVVGYFSIFRRGMEGVSQHFGNRHLHHHLAEFEFHYSNLEAVGYNDAARTVRALEGVVGTRLTYRDAFV